MRARSPGSPMSVMGKRASLMGRKGAADDRLPPRLATSAPDQTDGFSLSMLRLADDEIERVWVSKTAIEKELRLSLVSKDAEIRKLKQSVATSEAASEALKTAVERLQQEFLIVKASAEESDVAVVLKKLKTEIVAKDTEVHNASFARNDALGQVAKLQKSLDEVIAQRDRVSADLEIARRTIDFRIPELESANAAYLGDKEELENALTLRSAEIDQLRINEAKLGAELAAAQLKLKNRAKLAFDQELAAALAAGNAVVVARASELEKANKTIKYLESELATLKTENLGFFESEKTRLERKVAELTRLYEEEVTRGVENGEKAKKTAGLEEELRRASELYDKTVADSQSQSADLKAKLDTLKADNETLSAKCSKLQEYERIFQSSELHAVLRTLSDVTGNSKEQRRPPRP